jgi:tripartite-type tricarboxylate transporter receptor subunit TctC
VSRTHAEAMKALADPEVRQQFDAQGLEGVGMPPEEFAKFVAKESAFITDLARKIDAK